jgi:hypothetical protein
MIRATVIQPLRHTSSYLVRGVSSTGAKVFPALTSTEQIRELINKPTWNIYKELIEEKVASQEKDVHISKELVDKLLKMSGLEENQEIDISNKLREQVIFINKLHSVEPNEEAIKVEEDALSLKDIMEGISSRKQDESKGELGGLNPTKLASVSKNGYYIVREGLIKK